MKKKKLKKILKQRGYSDKAVEAILSLYRKAR